MKRIDRAQSRMTRRRRLTLARAVVPAYQATLEALESRRLLSTSDPFVNEFMTNNKTGLIAADGSHPDWIEIYNPAGAAVDLAGWTITAKDVNGVATTFTVPSTNASVTTVAAGGYKVILCDSKSNPINASGELHANFNLDKSGGSIVLDKPDGTVVSSFDPYPAQLTDVSYGPGPAIVTTTPVITTPSSATVTVPTDGTLGASWTQLGFDDSSWTAGTTGVGFENLGSSTNPPALPAEIETNDTPATANNGTTNFAAQASSNVYQFGLKGSLSSASDADFFKIGAMQAGDVLSVSASGSPSSRGTNADLHLDLYRGSNPSSLTLVTSDEDGGVGLDALIDRFAIATTDTYYVKVSTTTSKTGTYDMGLYLENTSTAPGTGGSVTSETESNNTAATANDVSGSWRQVKYLSHTTGQIGSATAVDYFKYTFTAGDLVTVNLDSTGTTADMKVTLYSSNGTTVVATEDGSSTRASPYSLDSTLYSFIVPSTGVYYVKATGSATGNYNLDLYLSTNTAPPVPGTGATPLYSSLINTNVGAAMQNVNATAYVRVPFTIADPTQVNSLILSMKYDDGFVAYINGQEVARSNAGGTAGTPLAYNAAAASDRTDSSGTTFQDFDISAFASALQIGNNVLAIQALNNSAADGRFLMDPELRFTTVTQPGIEYFTTPTPGAANVAGNLGTVKDTKFSEKRGFYEAPFDVTITDGTSGATIRYTTDGSTPTATHGTVYTGPIHVAGTTTLRAAAFKPGYFPTNVDTETYLFTANVATQTVPSGNYPSSSYPSTWAGDQGIGGTGVPSGSYPADYNINPAIVNPPAGSSWTNADFNAGLTQIPTISIVTDPANLFAPPVLNANGTAVVSGGIYQLPQEEGDAWEVPASVEYINPDGSTGFHEDVGLRTQGAAARQNSKQPKHSFRILFKSQYGDSTLSFPFFGPGSDGIDSIDFRATYNNSWTHTASTSPTDPQRNQAEYVRDGWNRVTQAAMGDLGLQSKFVQLYINGLYWGLYDCTERPESSYYAQFLGGSKDDYEVLNAGTPVDSPAANPNGAANDWAALNSQIDQTTTVNGQTVLNVSTDAGYSQIQQLLDVKNLADYIIQMLYAGNEDWDGGGHNWYVYRNANKPGGDGFKFIAWDSERTLEGTNDNVTGVNNVGAPSHLFHQLMNNAEFRLLVADRLNKFLFNNGALTPAVAAARYKSMSDQITSAIVDESARWGNYDSAYRGIGNQVFTKDNWTSSVNTILNNYFPVRTANVINQFKALGWYPTTDAAEYAQFGGLVPSGYQLAIDNSSANVANGGGVIYYTLDGSDPRLPGGAVSPTALVYDPNNKPTLTAGTEVQTRVLLNGVWSAVTDAKFFVGPAPALRVTEVMYHPVAPNNSSYSADDFGFIEFQNTGTTPIALQDFTITGGVTFTFPKGLPDLQPGDHTVVVANVAAFQSMYGTGVPIAGQYVGTLAHNTDVVTVTSPFGQEVESIVYQDGWYGVTDGGGYSLVAVDPNAPDATLATAAGWRPSTSLGGEPGAADPGVNPGSVVINEVLSNSTGISTGDWIELKNTTSAPIDVSYWYLSDDSSNLKKYQIPAGTVIPANGFVTFTQAANFGGAFTLADAGGSVFLTQGDSLGNVDGYRDSEDFGATDPGVTHGRYVTSTGAVDFPQLATPTFGADNAAPQVGPVVINEIMYDPTTGGDEYVELRNVTNSVVNLYDPANPADTWQFTEGITFAFPQGVSIPANGLALVVPIDPATFRSKYNIPASVQIFGPYTGALNNGGESLKLSRPGTPVGGVVPYITVDHVNYNNAAPWPTAAHGAGPSLERVDPVLYADDPANWRASAAAGGSAGAENLPAGFSASADAAYAFSAGPGAGQWLLTVTGGTVTLGTDLASTLPGFGVHVAGGSLVLSAASQHLASLTIDAGATATLTTTGATLTLASLPSIAAGGTLDVGAGRLLLDASAGATDADVRALLAAGEIVSSFASANAGYAVGYGTAADGVAGLTAGQLLVAPALVGDTTLKGSVGFGDYQNLLSSFGKTSGATWAQGDTNYDGAVGFGDYQSLLSNFGKTANITAPPPPPAAPASAAPSATPSTATTVTTAASSAPADTAPPTATTPTPTAPSAPPQPTTSAVATPVTAPASNPPKPSAPQSHARPVHTPPAPKLAAATTRRPAAKTSSTKNAKLPFSTTPLAATVPPPVPQHDGSLGDAKRRNDKRRVF